MTYDLLMTGLTQGFILALISLGMCISFRLLNFKDLSVEGAFPLGAVVFSTCLLAGHSVATATLIALLAGGISTLITAQIALFLQVNSLLAGILVSTCAYSINLKLMGKPNVALFHLDMGVESITPLILINVAAFFMLSFYLRTDFGLRFRAVGLGQAFCQLHRISAGRYTSLGLFLAGVLFAFAGIFTVHLQKFVDINMGMGLVIHGLAGLMLGESLFGRKSLMQQLISPVIGALTYQQIHGFVLSFGISPTDLKLMTSLFILFILAVKKGNHHAP